LLLIHGKHYVRKLLIGKIVNFNWINSFLLLFVAISGTKREFERWKFLKEEGRFLFIV